MSKVSLRLYNPAKVVDKNVLYRLNSDTNIECVEQHNDATKDIVNIEYCIKDEQYGIYAYEYKRPGLEKDGCKVADVLACIVDESNKEIVSLVFDIKRDISAFSDDLFKADAMITAIKEVRDFIKQIQEELLHKESFMVYYKAEGYEETEIIGIVTSSFEPEKFRDVAATFEKLMEDKGKDVPDLITLKLKNSLRPYVNLIETLYDFSERKVVIGRNVFELCVFLLKRVSETDYRAIVKLSS